MLSALALAATVSGITGHEGFSSRPYHDKNGISIGFGYSITHNPLFLPKSTLARYRTHGISKVEAGKLVERMVHKLDNELDGSFRWYHHLPNGGKYAMLDLSYNIGVGGVAKFKHAISYIEHGNCVLASNELLDSRWARQVGVYRSKHLAKSIKTGVPTAW